MEGLIVEKAGLLDTIQDIGRWGYQKSGISVAGAMDPFSYTVGNLLLGNKPGDASMEITLLGPRLRFTKPTYIALTGGDLQPKLNGCSISMWRPIYVKEGDLLTLDSARIGCRTYLSILGGFQTPPFLHSRSTYLIGKMGGLEGRAIRKGDTLPYQSLDEKTLNDKILNEKRSLRSSYQLSQRLIPDFDDPEPIIRVIPGPQREAFTQEGWETFIEKPYAVSNEMDRMGIRLQGPVIKHQEPADILSEAIPFGAIQVPADGQPIILMADRQTTGGYTKIGTVCSVDFSILAQLRPGQKIRFKPVSIDEAQELYRRQRNFLKALQIQLSFIL